MPVTITGMVFDDRNHNGVWDSGEPGISNVYLTLFNAPAFKHSQTPPAYTAFPSPLLEPIESMRPCLLHRTVRPLY